MLLRKYIGIFLLIFFNVNINGQSPEIKWWYDTDDVSYGSAATADIDEDGKLEIVFSCYRRDSSIYALNAEDGSLLWKRNLAESPNQGCNDVAPIISDVDLDGHLEVIVPASCNPRTFCLDGKTGEIKWVTKVHGSDSPPTIADIDEDGKPEILHGGFAGYITCLNGEDGSIFWDEQIEPNGTINGEVIILDSDNDGDLDIVTASWNFAGPSKIMCYQAKDLNLNWTYANDVAPMYHGPSFADIDEDGKAELVVSNQDGELLVINAEDGSLLWDFQFEIPFHNSIYATSIGDINNDNQLEILFFDYGILGALDAEGNVLWEYSIPGVEAFRGASLSDITNDEILDVIFAGGDYLYVVDGATGNEHWKINLAEHDGRPTFSLDTGILVADFDGDEYLDLFVTGGFGISSPTIENNFGRAYCISTESMGGPDWLMFRRDSVRSGAIPLEDTPSPIHENLGKEKTAVLYPNPTSEFINIISQDRLKHSLIQIYDLKGSIIFQGEYRNRIDCSKWSAGVYQISFSEGDQILYEEKIVKQ